MDDCAGSGECMAVAVEAEAGEFGDAELFAENAGSVVMLEGPVVNTAFDAAGTVEQRVLRGFKKLRGAREERFSRVQELEFVAERIFRAGARKFGALKFAGG